MSLTTEQLRHLGELARLRVEPQDQPLLLEQLDRAVTLLQRLDGVDTAGVAPMTHPQSVSLRLRDDAVTESDAREASQACAPAVENGLYLVPRVVE